MDKKRDEFTLRLLSDGGIVKGMRVLDVGCGTGDLCIMAAELVGNTGSVVGIDISETALLAAKKAVQEQKIATIDFLHADILGMPNCIGTFDAVIGRRVLMYQSNAVDSIAGLLPHLKTGGRMIFQESDSIASSLCDASLPLHARVQSWIWDTVAKEGGNVHIGMQLYSLMKRAGLSVSLLRSEAILHTYESGSDLGWVAKAMLPRITNYGVASAEEMNVDTLEDRLKSELKDSDIPFVRDMAFGVCAQK